MIKPERLKWKASLIIGMTFAIGAITGAALNGIYLHADSWTRNGRAPAPVLDALRRDLHLSDEQAVAVRGAVEDTRRELRAVRFDQCPGFADARRRLIERVRPLLTREQQQRFSAVVEEGQMRRELPPGGGR
jgi:hypothetical protein